MTTSAQTSHGWVDVGDGYQLALRDDKLICRNDAGKLLRSVPKAVRQRPVAERLVALRDWLARHARECATTVETWMLGSFPLPATLPAAVWPDEGYAAMAERVSSGALPAGRYESDPAACVPDVLADVRARLGLEADPARLYLQLLTLLEPTDRNVRRWNGWTPAQHRKAIATLVEHGLVVEDKRARAGRSAFLPGPWPPAKAPNLPLERSKLELYRLCLHDDGGVHGWLSRWLPTRPLTDLFTEAWQHAASTGEPR